MIGIFKYPKKKKKYLPLNISALKISSVQGNWSLWPPFKHATAFDTIVLLIQPFWFFDFIIYNNIF